MFLLAADTLSDPDYDVTYFFSFERDFRLNRSHRLLVGSFPNVPSRGQFFFASILISLSPTPFLPISPTFVIWAPKVRPTC